VHRQESPERKTGESERQIKNPMRDAGKPALPDGNAQIILIRRVMNDVKVPEKARFVADAVKPVIKKIVGKKQNHPSPPNIHRQMKQRKVLINSFVKKSLNNRENRPERHASKSERDVRPNIFAIIIFLVPYGKKNFNRNHQREKRNGDKGWFQHFKLYDSLNLKAVCRMLSTNVRKL